MNITQRHIRARTRRYFSGDRGVWFGAPVGGQGRVCPLDNSSNFPDPFRYVTYTGLDATPAPR
jgi:hypothetical protein